MSIKNTVLSAAISSSVLVSAQSGGTETSTLSPHVRSEVNNILWYCNPSENSSDTSVLTQIHTIQSWETMSSIVRQYWITLNNLVRFLSICPWYDNFDIHRIRAGDQIPILTERWEERMEELRGFFIEEERISRITNLLEEWDLDTIRLEYWYRVFPQSPSIGLERGYEALTQLLSDRPRTLGPRSVMPDIRHSCNATCMHLIKRAVYYLLWPDHPELQPWWAYDFIAREWVNAWHIWPAALETGFFERHFDTRHMFNSWFLSNQSRIINSSDIDEYLQTQIELWQYLREQWVPWTFIPTLFSGTGSARQIVSQNWWWWSREPNSHSFLFTWNTTSEFHISEIDIPWNTLWSNSISLEDFLVYFVKHQWQIFTVQSLPDSVLRENIRAFWDIIDIEIDWNAVHISQDLDNQDIRVYDNSSISITGSIVIDWLQVWESQMCTAIWRRQMEMRLLHFFSVAVWKNYRNADQNGRWFYFTSIIEPERNIWSMHENSWSWSISRQLPLPSFIQAGIWDDVQTLYMSEISRDLFEKELDELSEEENTEVNRIYSIHSQAHQIIWFQNTWWVSWNDWATNVNAPIPYYWVDTASLSQIEAVYRRFVSEREREYMELLELQSSRPFVEVVVFLRGAPRQLLRQVELQLSDEYRQYLRDFTSVQRLQFAEFFLTPKANWSTTHITWDSIIISIADIERYIDLMRKLEISNFTLNTLHWNSNLDSLLIESITTNELVRWILAFILANESYVNPCNDCTRFYQDAIWWLQVHFASRRWVKDLVTKINQNWWSKSYNDFISFLWDNTGIIGELRAIWIQVPMVFPNINSMGDFQARYTVLRWVNNSNLLPWGIIYNYLQALLWESIWDDRINQLVEQVYELENNFPNIIQRDREIARDLYNELQKETLNHGQIHSLLMRLLRLNDGTDSNIVGKILELLVMEERIRNSLLNNIIEQYLSAWWTMQSSDSVEIQDFLNAAVLANHTGEHVQLITFSENYMLRIIESIMMRDWLSSDRFPSIETNNIGQTIYWEWIFRRHLVSYIEILEWFWEQEGISIENQIIVEELLSQLRNIKDSTWVSELNSSLFKLFRQPQLREYLENNTPTSSYFPTPQELGSVEWIQQEPWVRRIRDSLFRYNWNIHRVEDRVQKPELNETNKSLLLTMALIPIILLINRLSGIIWSWFVRSQWRDEYRRLKKQKKNLKKTVKNIKVREELWIKVKSKKNKLKEYKNISRTYTRIAWLPEFTPITYQIVGSWAKKIIQLGDYFWAKIKKIQSRFWVVPKKVRPFLNDIDSVNSTSIDRYIENIKTEKRNQEIGIHDDDIIFWNTRWDGTDNYFEWRVTTINWMIVKKAVNNLDRKRKLHEAYQNWKRLVWEETKNIPPIFAESPQALILEQAWKVHETLINKWPVAAE